MKQEGQWLLISNKYTFLVQKLLCSLTFTIQYIDTILCSHQATLIRSAATSYLLNSGIQWGAAPAVKVRT